MSGPAPGEPSRWQATALATACYFLVLWVVIVELLGPQDGLQRAALTVPFGAGVILVVGALLAGGSRRLEVFVASAVVTVLALGIDAVGLFIAIFQTGE